MDIISVDLNDTSLEDVNFVRNDPKTIIHVIYMTWHIRFKRLKAL